MKKLFLLFFTILSLNVLSINFPETGKRYQDFVPKGWDIVQVVKGDLNKDKIEDVAMIIKGTDPNKIDYESGENNNPLAILVLFKNKNSTYRLAGKNDIGLIEHGEYINWNEGQIYKEINIAKNHTLHINEELYHNGYTSQGRKYIFRYQNNRFELIGLEDYTGYHTYTSDESSEVSINFSTQELIITDSLIFNGDPDSKIEEERPQGQDRIETNKAYIKVKNKYTLDTMTADTYDNEIYPKIFDKDYGGLLNEIEL